MTNSPYVRAVMVQASLRLVPPLIRETLIEDADFREKYGITSDVVISLGNSGNSFQRSSLYIAIRKFLSDVSANECTDKSGRKWELKNIGEEGELPGIALSRGEQRFILPNLTGLSPDSTTRLRYLDEAASDVNLPSCERERWSNILSERTLEDDEVHLFHSDLQHTPVDQARSIRNEISKGHISISSLVPTSRSYFERLIGTFDGSTSIHCYAVSTGRTFFEQLSSWRPYDGFLFSLLLSSHFALTAEINVDQLGSEDLVRAYEFLDNYGDRISQLGAIEVGLRVITSRPEIELILIRLIEQFRDDDVNEQDSGFHIITSLFILVDGELSRTRLFSTEPPFYRRLAALSQAALIYRELINSGVGIDSFCKWAFSNRGEQYYLQSLADMRMEPYWNPDLASASQTKSDFFGRIMIEAMNYEQNIKGGELSDLIFGTNSRSLLSLSKFPHSYFPGPLEGTEAPRILPAEISEAIETQLGAEEVTPLSFIALVNSALIFRVGANHAELAAKALKVGSYRLAKVEDRSKLLAILNGLATVAAITRSCELADELRILARIYRRDAQYALSIEEVMRICLVAASSHEGLKEWRDFAGDWLTELAFGDLECDDGETLHSHLQCLCHAVPELWVTCGRADAALMAYNARS